MYVRVTPEYFESIDLQVFLGLTYTFLSFSLSTEQGEEGKAPMERAQEGKGCQEASSIQAQVCQYDPQGRKEGLVVDPHGRRLSPIRRRSGLARLVGGQGLLLVRAEQSHGPTVTRKVCHGDSAAQCHGVAPFGSRLDGGRRRYTDTMASHEGTCHALCTR